MSLFAAGFYFLFLKTAPQFYAWMVLPFLTPLSQQIVATVLEYKSQCKRQWTLDSWIFPFTGVAPLFLLRHYRSALPDEMTQSIPLGVWEDLGHLFTDTYWEIQGVCKKIWWLFLDELISRKGAVCWEQILHLISQNHITITKCYSKKK